MFKRKGFVLILVMAIVYAVLGVGYLIYKFLKNHPRPWRHDNQPVQSASLE